MRVNKPHSISRTSCHTLYIHSYIECVESACRLTICCQKVDSLKYRYFKALIISRSHPVFI